MASKIDKLLAKLCPNGVEYKKFEDVCFYIRGVTYNKSQESRGDVDSWKVLRANNITLFSNTLNFDDVKLIRREVKVRDNQKLKSGDILICAGSGSKEHVGKVAYIDSDIDYIFGGFMAVIRCSDQVNSRYLFHILTGKDFSNYLAMALNSATINNLNSSVMNEFKFPVPPLEIQREVVEVLDKFALLTAELTAELEKRKKQYEHYRDKLLNFTGGGTFEWLTLGDTCVITTGKLNANAMKIDGEYPFFTCSDTVSRIDVWAFDCEALLVAGNGNIGETKHYVGKFNAYQRTYVLHSFSSSIMVRFLYHVLRHGLKAYVKQYSKDGTLPYITLPVLSNYSIPLPPLAEQERIVKILDRFDKLCNDLTSGLPAEIAARKKQYEYYRDKLLSFKRAG